MKEGVPIKDLSTIIETLVDALGQGRDIDSATEQCVSMTERGSMTL